jgi:N-acetylglucosamine kinase-like BadF-type ATPase
VEYIIGLDQGGSKTAAVVADARGNILGYGVSGGANHASTGMEYAMKMAREACDKALSEANLTIDNIEIISAGLTGADWPFEYDLLRDNLQKATGIKNVKVVNDCIIAMRGGTSKPYGAIICAGSGLNVAARNPEGTEYVFGYYIDDDYQGGGALGRNTIKAVFFAEAGIIQPTILTGYVLNFYGIQNVDDLLFKRVNGQLPGDVRDLTPLLFKAAEAGDNTSIKIITEFGQGIAAYAIAGLKRLNMLELELDVVLSGSVFKADSPILREVVTDAILEKVPKARIVNAVYEPVVGGMILALDTLYKGVPDEDVMKNVYDTSKKFGLIRVREDINT